MAYPTEGVWGLGCDPFNPAAVQRLLRLKQRDPAKGLILIAGDIGQLEPLLTDISQSQRQQLLEAWPAPVTEPVTYIVPANNRVPTLVKGEHSGIALRVSAHKPVIDLCRAFGGPVVSSSANIAGMPAAQWPWQIKRQLGDQLDFLLPGPLGGAKKPSEIRDLISGTVLRKG